MGTYTELVLKCRIKNDIPKIVHGVLSYLFGKDENPPCELPDHVFFKKISWHAIGRSNSYYHIPYSLSFYDGNYLFSRSDLKNYYDEIEQFLDWIKPYLNNAKGEFIGWIFLEESENPIFIYND